ncbi:MAG: hypothetical protein DRN08_08035, partial [Thermoplasmata archaeon]
WDVAHVSGVATVRCVAPTVLTHNVAPREVGRCPPTGAHVHATNGGSRPRQWKIWGRPYTLAGTGTLTGTSTLAGTGGQIMLTALFELTAKNVF